MRRLADGATDMNPGNLPISAIVIARNEAERIEKCLNSLRWVNEILLIDNGSTDQTAALAEQQGAQVISVSGQNFANLRNIGKQQSSGQWLLYIDADELVTEALSREVKEIVRKFNHETDPVAYFIRRQNYYLGKLWPVQDRMQRLFWKPALIRWQGKLHETAEVRGITSELQEPLIHHTHRTLEEMVAKTNAWSEIEAELRIKAHHPTVSWWRLLRVIWTGFSDSFFRQGGWRAGAAGWIESIYQGFSLFITYAKLWERQQADPQSKK